MKSRNRSRKANNNKSKSPGQAPSSLPPTPVSASKCKKASPSPLPNVKELPVTPCTDQAVEEQNNVEDPRGQRREGLRLSDSVGEILMPGDAFLVSSSDGPVILGPGLQLKPSFEEDQKDKVVTVNKAGILIQGKGNTFYIDMTARSYLPYKQDDVIGVITKRSGDQYVVDVGTRDRVTLSKFGFEGATKKNKPELKIGDIVFGRFMDLPSDFPFEISCITGSGKAMGHGPLEGGFLFQIPSPAVRVLQTAKRHGGSDIVKRLGQILPFEMTLGVNGYVWVKSKFDLANILIARTIEASWTLPPEDHNQLLFTFRNSLQSIQGLLTSK